MIFAIQVAFLAFQLASAGYALYKNSNRTKVASTKTLEIPHTTEGLPIPIFWGKIKITQPVLADYFGFHAGPSGGSDAGTDTAGLTDYFTNMLFVLGITPEQCEQFAITKIWIGDRPLPGGLSGFNGASSGEQGVSIRLTAPDQGAGTIIGIISTFGPKDVLGDVGFADYKTCYDFYYGDTTLCPDFLGMAKVAFSSYPGLARFGQPITPGWLFGQTDAIDPYAFEALALPYGDDTGKPAWFGSRNINGDMNPIGVIYDICTGRLGKLKLPEVVLDLDSFTAAATALTAEGHGFSGVLYERRTAGDVIADILQQIGGLAFQDPVTGKLSIKLVRDDYDHTTVPTFDESDVLADQDISCECGLWNATYNRIDLTYTSRVDDYNQKVQYAPDSASIAATGLRSLPITYAGICDAATAARVASRELKAASLPLRKLSVVMRRTAAKLRIGDVFKFSFAQFGLVDVIFRVLTIDYGDLQSGMVSIESAEDVFAIDDAIQPAGNGWQAPGDVPIATAGGASGAAPLAMFEHGGLECPRFIQRQALLVNQITDADAQHVLYTGAPLAPDLLFRGDAASTVTGDGSYTPDSAFSAYPILAVLHADLGKADDTLVLEQVTGGTLTATTADLIRSQGINLCLVGTGDTAEIIAFEGISVTLGIATATTVHRGLLDTVPRVHAAGARFETLAEGGWINASKRVGRLAFVEGDTIQIKAMPQGFGGATLDRNRLDARALPITARSLRPLPVGSFTVDDAAIATGIPNNDDSIVAAWNRRARLDVSVKDQDDGDQPPEAGTVYRLYAQVGDFPEVDITPGGADMTGPGTVTPAHLATAGHGIATVKLRTSDASARTSLQDPSVDVVAPNWRNLLLNGRFVTNISEPGNGWTNVTGADTDTLEGTGRQFGGGGTAFGLTGASHEEILATQIIPTAAWTDGLGLGGLLEFYVRNQGASQPMTVTVELLDASASTLATIAYSDTPSDTLWEAQLLALPMQPGGVAYRITVDMPGDGGSTTVSTGIDGMIFRICQMSDEQIVNGSLDTDTTGWTITGAFSTETTGPLAGVGFALGGSSATNTLAQTITPPTGYEANAVAVLAWWTKITNSDANDKVGGVLTATNGTDTETSTIADFTPPTLDIWKRQQQVVAIPPGCTSVVATLRALKVGGTIANIGFDQVSLRFFKAAEPSWSADAEFTAPVIQPMPITVERWCQDVAACPPPLYLLMSGADFNSQAPQPASFTASSGVSITPDVIGAFDGTGYLTSGYAFATGAAIASDDRYAFANFSVGRSWAVLFAVRIDPIAAAALGAAFGIAGRYGDTSNTGWRLLCDSSGVPALVLSTQVNEGLVDTPTTKTVTGASSIADGRLHFIGIHFTPANGVSLIVDGVATAPAALGFTTQIATNLQKQFFLGKAEPTGNSLPGQVARAWMWSRQTNDVLMPTPAMLAGLFVHGADPSQLLDATAVNINAADTVLAVVRGKVGTDRDAGLRLARFARGQAPIAYADQWGLASSRAPTNLITAPFTDATVWSNVGLSTYTTAGLDAEGWAHAAEGTSDAGAHYLQAVVPLGAGADVRVSFLARLVLGADHVLVELRDSADILKGSAEVAIGTAGWERIDVSLAWDAATANGHLRIYPVKPGLTPGQRLAVSPGVVVHQAGAFYPELLPVPGIAALTAPVAWTLAAPIASAGHLGLAYDGELIVAGIARHAPELDGVLVTAEAASGDHNRRELAATASGALAAVVYDASATTAAATTSDATDANWRAGYNLRSRWSRLGLLTSGDQAHAIFAIEDELLVLFSQGESTALTIDAAAPLERVRLPASDTLVSRLQVLQVTQARYQPAITLTLVSIAVMTADAPGTPLVWIGAPRAFTAIASYNDGSMVDVTATAVWSTSDASLATIGAGTGIAAGVAVGAPDLTATIGAVSGSITAAVVLGIPVDAHDQLVWRLDDLSSPWINTGVGSTTPLVEQADAVIAPVPASFSGPIGTEAAFFAGNADPTNTDKNFLATDSARGANDEGEFASAITVSAYVYLIDYGFTIGLFNVLLSKAFDTTTTGTAIGMETNSTNDGAWYFVGRPGGVEQYVGFTSGTNIPTGAWVHVGVTYDGTTIKNYQNGVLTSSVAATPSGAIDFGSHGAWEVGGGQNYGNTIHGYMQDVRVADVVRDAAWFLAMAALV